MSTWRQTTQQFEPYFKDYEASLAQRRDRGASWVACAVSALVVLERPPVAGYASSILMERMEGPYRVWKVLSDYRVVLETLDGADTVPKAT